MNIKAFNIVLSILVLTQYLTFAQQIGNQPNNNNENNNNINKNTPINNNKDPINNEDPDSITTTPTNVNNEDRECASDKSSLGMFSFHRPISKSILVVNSNFTIIWYYNNIVNNPNGYNYPVNNITLKLFYEEDADSNNWASSWKDPVWVKTLDMSEIEEGPTLRNNVKSYQWNWDIIPDLSEGFLQNPKTNERFKLRIYGDGRDIQSNSENFECYSDNDIQPGITRAFYLVENSRIAEKYYRPINIPDGAYQISINLIKILAILTSTILLLIH